MLNIMFGIKSVNLTKNKTNASLRIRSENDFVFTKHCLRKDICCKFILPSVNYISILSPGSRKNVILVFLIFQQKGFLSHQSCSLVARTLTPVKLIDAMELR